MNKFIAKAMELGANWRARPATPAEEERNERLLALRDALNHATAVRSKSYTHTRQPNPIGRWIPIPGTPLLWLRKK